MASNTKQAVSRRNRRAAGYKEYKLEVPPEKAAVLKDLATHYGVSINKFLHQMLDRALLGGSAAKAW
jgi:hypothetical protein